MAEIREAVFSWLTAGAAVSATLGNRVYPRKAAQDAAYPHAVYEQTAHEQARSMRRYLNLYGWAADWHVHGETEAQVRAAAVALRDRLLELNTPGAIGGGAFRVLSVRFDGDEGDSFEPPVDADENGVHTVDLSCVIHYRRG